MEPTKRIQVVFFQTPAGKEPVRQWLKDMPIGDKRPIGEDIKTNWNLRSDAAMMS